jgi:iron complex outermembrane receptor protein
MLAIAVAQSAGAAHAQTIIPQSVPATPGMAAAPTTATKGFEEVIVTAQKRSEKLQKVPMSIQVLDTKALEKLNVTEFQDYVKFLPSVAFQTGGPNQTSIYMRGVASGDNANHSGPLPTVGSYLDELPITTIGGVLDVHVYDMARIESLPGPQGTLYGASSEAGTLRLITNKPDPSGFSAGYDIQGNTVEHGGQGFIGEGYVNIPLTPNAAVRLVAFDEHDAGYIDNVFGTRTFTTSGDTINNAKYAGKDSNPADSFGGRGELRVDLNEDWSILTTVLAQDQRNAGSFAYEPSVGYLQVQRFNADSDHDRWEQAGLTVTGKIGDFTLTYSGGVFLRDVHQRTDYTDYSIFYDATYGSGAFWQDKNGNPLANPQQEIDAKDHFNKESNEIRLASPSDNWWRFIVGAFQEIQDHRIEQDYQIQGFGPQIAVPGWANTIWLTDQERTDRDEAVFGELSLDVLPNFTITAGVRPYWYDNSLKGFFGFSEGYDALTGYNSGQGATGQNCYAGQSFSDAPCVNLNKDVTGNGETHKVNLTYKIDDQRLVYFTYSTGYRPGGVNRNGNFGPYQADSLTNYEVGFKSSWLGNTLRFNTAAYVEDWNLFQFSFLGPNSLTIIENAPAANIRGIESALEWKASPQLTLSSGATLTDAVLESNFCGTNSNTGQLLTSCSAAYVAANEGALKGTQLPYTPPFKGNLSARYTFDLASDWTGHVQSSIIYQSRNHVGLREEDNALLGSMPSYETVDLAAGVERHRLSIELFAKNLFDSHGEENRFTPCTISVCAANIAGIPRAIYVIPVQPLTVGLRISQKF